MNNIIILGQQRTGSNLLCYALSFFENYRNINEFYSVDPNSFVYDMYFTNDEKDNLFNTYNTTDWRTLLARIHNDPVKAFKHLSNLVGNQNIILKLLDHQFDKTKSLYSIIDNSNKFIILERSNTLEQYVSLKIAQENDIWGAESTNHCKIHLDISDYQNFCVNKELYYADLKERVSTKDYIIVNYEEDLENGITDKLLKKLQMFLEDSPSIIDKDRNWVWKKQRTVDCNTQISNYNDIKDLLK